MSAGEITWRILSSLRNCTDRILLGHRQRTRKPSAFLNGDKIDKGPEFRVSDIVIGESIRSQSDGINNQQHDSLLARAERIAEHRFDFFDQKDKYLGDTINWNHDYKRGHDTPMTYCSSMDYWNVEKNGDCKFVWQTNRHHQLVVLGRAWRLSGDIKFAEAVAEQLDSWLKQNPYGVGMNWCSGVELGIRLINWVWALDLIKESKVINGQLQNRILDSISRHIWEINRKYPRGSSVNNQLIGQAAGVFIATSYFGNLKNALNWHAKSRAILNREILNQTFTDGGNKEQAIGYHLFVLQFFVAAGIAARVCNKDFPESYWSRLEKKFEFIGALSEGGDTLPAFGDSDDSYVLDVGSDSHSVQEWLAVGAALFQRSDFKAWAGQYTEPVEWLLGKEERQCFKAIQTLQNKTCTSKAFKESGYYLLQHGKLNSSDRISVVFDCGPLGMGATAEHGHADALSFTLRAFGTDILIDPGTYDYISYPKWRKYFRSTRAHNTVVIDGLNQSEMLGPFLWGQKAKSECLSWQPSDVGGKVIGQHDGYMHLDDPVTHKRMLDLDGQELVVRDDIIARGIHKIEIFFHLTEHCVVNPAGKNRYLVYVSSGTIEIDMDPSLQVETFNGSENPICGWRSRGYHQKQASTTIVGHCTGKGDTCLVSRINIGKQNPNFPFEQVQKIRNLKV
ncbi:MAG: alginate lyase family protein [Sedimentisphaerales bacterium]|nr:alginate lyase family protein [Sedimentisphaerales bacterium]